MHRVNISRVGVKYYKYWNYKKNIPTPGLEPGPLKDKVLSLACLPISSHRLVVLLIILRKLNLLMVK